MTKSSERYNADEQADFMQTEAEEWATEIALRIKEGNHDPIPAKKSKNYEQHDFTYVSLFSGIGGFEQALNKLGGTCVLASEIDKFAEQSYQTLYGHATVGDITKVSAEDVPDHDVLVGGFPCQAFSVAGKRGGFEDARGTLFFEMARIAKEKQPKVFLAENVKGLVGHDKGRTLDTIVKTLNDIGYRVDFEVLNSKYFGVPQNRERIFIVAIREDLVENEPWNIEGTTVVPKGKRRISGYEDVKTFNFGWPDNDEVTTRLRDILETDVDEKYYLSEDKTAKLVAQLEEKVATKDSEEVEVVLNADKDVIKDNERQRRIYSTNGISPTTLARTDNAKILTAGYADIKGASKQIRQVVHTEGVCPTVDTMQGGHREPKIAEPQMLGHVDIKGHDAVKRVYSTEHVGPTLTTMGGGHREPKIVEQQQFSDGSGISHCLDANYAKGTSPGDVGKGRRTHVKESAEVRPVLTPDRMEKRQNGRRFKEDGEEAHTLTAQDRHGIALGNPPKYRIRKLTPLECWRLQGFPDEAHEAVKDAGISDSQRYKQAGNAVTVNVIEEIGERLLPYLTAVEAEEEVATTV